MPQQCTICTHTHRPDIEAALVAGTSFRTIAEQYGTSTTTLHRHKPHIAEALAAVAKSTETKQEAQAVALARQQAAQEIQDVRQALDVVQQLKAINGAALQVLRDARDRGDGNLALKAIDRLQRQIELQAKLLGDLQPDGTTNINISAEWVQLRALIVQTLTPYPEARAAVAQALIEVDHASR